MTALNPVSPKSSGRERGIPRFAILVIGLLAAHVIGMGTAIYLATRPSPGAVVEPNYYERAINWDRDRGGTK